MYGVYQQSRLQWHLEAEAQGHSAAASAKVKRGGKHITFKRREEAEAWVKANAKGRQMYVRKISKPLECK